MKYIPVGVDIAKHLMQVHFVDEYSGEVIDKQIKRDAFLVRIPMIPASDSGDFDRASRAGYFLL